MPDAAPDPWADRDELAAAAASCRAARERLLTPLAARLDALHGTSLGARYWRIVLGPWLLYHLQQLEDRRRRVEAGLRTSSPPDCLAAKDFAAPRDTDEYHDLFQTDRYRLQLAALVLRHLGARGNETPAPPPERPAAPRPGARALLRSARAAASAAARHLLRADFLSDGLYPLGARHEELAKALDFRLWPILDAFPEALRAAAVLDARRRSLSELAVEGGLERLAVSTLPESLPAIFLEGFAPARERARRALGRPPRVMVHSSGIHYRDFYKFCAAEALADGARLVGFQHGGYYGTALWSNAEWHERSICDLYLTWGWDDGKRACPVPVPGLSAPPRRAPTRAGILYVSTSGLKTPHELSALPLGVQWLEFFAWRGRFFESLGNAGRDAARVRLYPADYGWNEKGEIAARWPELRLDDGARPLARSLESAALVVTDHPGTTFLETIAWGIPGVHFWDPRLWEMRPAAALEPLRRAGVVHADPESAARKALEVRADPDAWWNSPEVRAAREGFAESYARADPAWASVWAAILRRELELAGSGIL